MSFLFINKTLWLNNLKTRTAMNTKISVFVICVKAIIYLLLYDLHDCTFELCYVYVNFKRTNQSCSSSIISQSINVEWRTCDRNGKQFFQWNMFHDWKQEKLWSFDKLRNVLVEKYDMGSEKHILLNFATYLSFSEVQRIMFQQEGSLF